MRLPQETPEGPRILGSRVLSLQGTEAWVGLFSLSPTKPISCASGCLLCCGGARLDTCGGLPMTARARGVQVYSKLYLVKYIVASFVPHTE